jgi:adenylate cyclase
MKAKLWLFCLPFVVFFSFCYWVTELGVQGRLTYPLLREGVFPTLSRYRNLLTDLKFKTRGIQYPKNKIVVVDVDSPALETLGRWPWHRDVMAYVVEKTFAAGAKVVGLDVIFSEEDRRVPKELAKLLAEKHLESLIGQFETDRQLEEVIKRHPDQLVMAWATEQYCQPFYSTAEECPVTDPNAIAQYPKVFEKYSLQELRNWRSFNLAQTPLISFLSPIINLPRYTEVAKHAGYINAVIDTDGLIRRTHLVTLANGKPYPSLALEMARVGLKENLYVELGENQKLSGMGFSHSKRPIHVTPLGVMEINFRGPSEVFPHIPVLDVLSEKDIIEDPYYQRLTGKSKTELLKDAYVFIGLSAIGVFDMRHFPFQTNAPGVDGHANILDNLLSDDPLVPSSSSSGKFWIPLLMILGILLFSLAIEKLDAVPALGLFLAVLAASWYVDFKILFNNNQDWNTVYYYLEIVTVFAFALAAKYILEERSKKFIRGAFSKYVAPQVVESILKDPTKLSLGGERRDVSILFSDIRGFTTFSEKMDAKSLSSFLNDYLGIMSGLVFSHQGTLDKYIGDAVMAFWGAPLLQAEHAWNACQTAVRMHQALAENGARFKQTYGIEVRIGIGVNTGVVSVGNMGSEQNFAYTVIGDHVNLASRLEGLTKEYGVGIITSRFTFEAMRTSGKPVLPHRVLDSVKVKGKEEAVELIQILYKETSSEGLSLFTEARDLYLAQKWDEAIAKFGNANQKLMASGDKPDGPCELYLERCQKFKKEPPAADWDGSWKMTTK